MNLTITFDVEIWCNGWSNLDERFPSSFERYVYGADRTSGYALPKTLEILDRNGLRAVFFVEPLFSYRFGHEYLQEITNLIVSGGHEVQLHLHPEWADEVTPPLVNNATAKRPYMHQYNLEEQEALIAAGIAALEKCNIARPTAFRAGSYACNRDTMRALRSNNISIDSSVNAVYPGSAEDLTDSEKSNQPKLIEGVIEFPVTTFTDGLGKPRHWQVGAVGYRESQSLIEQALRQNYSHLILVSHNFEMLIPGSSRKDTVVVSRFERLCRYLRDSRSVINVDGFGSEVQSNSAVSEKLSLPAMATVKRISAQAARRIMEKVN